MLINIEQPMLKVLKVREPAAGQLLASHFSEGKGGACDQQSANHNFNSYTG